MAEEAYCPFSGHPLRTCRTLSAAIIRRTRHKRRATWEEHDTPEGRWRSYSNEEFRARDEINLDNF